MSFRNLALLTAALAGFSIPCFAQIPSDTEIHKILKDRVGATNLGIAIVVGVIDANGRRVVSYGSLAKNDNRRLDGDTVFEIGSISKVFTSLLLMDMVRRGEVSVNDPVSKYLPTSVKVPERNSRKITLVDLSTQSSGLPRMPTNFHPKDLGNPYADYTVQQMYDFISGYQLTRDIGSKYEYSNLGVGLLGHVLSLRSGMSYEALLRSRICDRLGMTSTRITLTPEMKAHLAVGHNASADPVPNWDLPTLAGAGAIRSTANDMLIFLSANLGYTQTPLSQAMADEVSIRRPTGMPDMEIAYAWHVQTKYGSSIIWHNGGTGGYRTYAGFDPKARTGVVVLTNISTAAGADDIGRHLLNPSYELLKIAPPTEHQEIHLDAKVFDGYVGAYQFGPWALMTISRDGEHFYSQVTGQSKVEIQAESDRKFFAKSVGAEFTFDVDAQGVVTQLILHQNGVETAGKRLTDGETQRSLEAIAAHNADVAKRLKDQTQSPGTEAALRRSIRELQQGEPDYNMMSPAFAALMRQQLPQLKDMMGHWGAIQSVKFKGVAPGGGDIYDVEFEHSGMQFTIFLGPDGKTQGIGLRPF